MILFIIFKQKDYIRLTEFHLSLLVFVSDEDLQILSLQCDGTFLYALFSNSLLLKIGTGYNSTVQGHVYKEKIIADFEGTSHSDDDFPKLLMWFEVIKVFLCVFF